MPDLPVAPPMPAGIAALPRDARGYPIPFTVFVDADGTPDFRVIDQEKLVACARERRCGLCGDPLGYWIAFVGGPVSHANREFADAPMHRECASYAMAVCPFLALRRAHRSGREVTVTGAVVVEDAASVVDRPERMGMFVTRRYEVRRSGHQIHFRAAPFKEAVWFTGGDHAPRPTPPAQEGGAR
jgi:hypothetical protein